MHVVPIKSRPQILQDLNDRDKLLCYKQAVSHAQHSHDSLLTMLRAISKEMPSPRPRASTLSDSHRRTDVPAAKVIMVRKTKGTPEVCRAKGATLIPSLAPYMTQ